MADLCLKCNTCFKEILEGLGGFWGDDSEKPPGVQKPSEPPRPPASAPTASLRPAPRLRHESCYTAIA